MEVENTISRTFSSVLALERLLVVLSVEEVLLYLASSQQTELQVIIIDDFLRNLSFTSRSIYVHYLGDIIPSSNQSWSNPSLVPSGAFVLLSISQNYTLDLYCACAKSKERNGTIPFDWQSGLSDRQPCVVSYRVRP